MSTVMASLVVNNKLRIPNYLQSVYDNSSSELSQFNNALTLVISPWYDVVCCVPSHFAFGVVGGIVKGTSLKRTGSTVVITSQFVPKNTRKNILSFSPRSFFHSKLAVTRLRYVKDGRARAPSKNRGRVVRWANSLDDAVLAHKFPVVRIRCFFRSGPGEKMG